MCGPDWDPASAELLELVEGDLLALARRDPAAHGSWREVLGTYRAFRAVLAYRLAHSILTTARLSGSCVEHSRILARDISEQAKSETGVEIHPAARIGPRFVVDHGMGTVVGETTVIGSDCYLLQCVVLGSLRVADNPTGRRHPMLGHRVEVGAYARILGPVRIGDDVRIGSHVLVRDDVPELSRVSVLHHYQVVAGRTDLAVTGVEPAGRDRFRLYGRGLQSPALWVEKRDWNSDRQPVSIIERADDHLLVELPGVTGERRTYMRLNAPDGSSVSLLLTTPHTARRSELAGPEATADR
ncbi:serine O-acetyltransferase [Salinispora oceanensis]|uniref:serine O-acetyltransferase n=1 Tax=Salinispora oceanensis TaxID=1050199 RepID=UPI00036EB416|nr:serine O-acetyltransferase [Salinispora oceanensis]